MLEACGFFLADVSVGESSETGGHSVHHLPGFEGCFNDPSSRSQPRFEIRHSNYLDLAMCDLGNLSGSQRPTVDDYRVHDFDGISYEINQFGLAFASS